MAVEWYLYGSPQIMSGNEFNDFQTYSSIAIDEALNAIGKDVLLYDSDFIDANKDGTQIKVIISNRVKDTQLNSLKRLFITKIGTFKAGQYLFYDDRYWLITSLVDNNGLYEKAVGELCEYCLRWQNSKHDIIKRWANLKSASQYNNGETASKYITLSSDQLMVLMPMDKETIELDNPTRFFISKSINKHRVYKITRNDSEVYDYTDSGLINLIVSKDIYNKETDVIYDENNNLILLCDYVRPIVDVVDINRIDITYVGESKIKVNGNKKKFTATIYNSNNEVMESKNGLTWLANDERIKLEPQDNYVKIYTTDSTVTGKTVTLSVTDNYSNIKANINILVTSY